MERKDFLKSVGAAGLSLVMASLLKACKEDGLQSSSNNSGSCVIIPQETVGPYPLDLSSNPGFFRQDVTEGKAGLPLDLTLNIVNVNNNCSPITNARVDIWHCDKDGVYSGFANQPGGVNTTGQTFCRGIQLTDSNGQVKFTTIYPGWYNGRITHIHFQVYLNNGLIATSQVAFPDDITRVVYDTALYAARGQNTSVASNAADMVFGSPSGDLQYELCTIMPNSTTGGYDAALNVGIAV
jgi:protocatechuate 3,4-dioxygenase beta subunit